MDGVARREALIIQWNHPLSCRFPLANIKWSSDTSGESPNALTPWSSGRPVRSQVQPCEWHVARALSRRRIITRLVDKLRQWNIKRQLNSKPLLRRLSEKKEISLSKDILSRTIFETYPELWNHLKSSQNSKKKIKFLYNRGRRKILAPGLKDLTFPSFFSLFFF